MELEAIQRTCSANKWGKSPSRPQGLGFDVSICRAVPLEACLAGPGGLVWVRCNFRSAELLELLTPSRPWLQCQARLWCLADLEFLTWRCGGWSCFITIIINHRSMHWYALQSMHSVTNLMNLNDINDIIITVLFGKVCDTTCILFTPRTFSLWVQVSTRLMLIRRHAGMQHQTSKQWETERHPRQVRTICGVQSCSRPNPNPQSLQSAFATVIRSIRNPVKFVECYAPSYWAQILWRLQLDSHAGTRNLPKNFPQTSRHEPQNNPKTDTWKPKWAFWGLFHVPQNSARTLLLELLWKKKNQCFG